LCLVTAPPKDGRDAPYEDEFDEASRTFTYHYRRPRSDSVRARLSAAADNRALKEALRLGVPLIYFSGIAPGQYTPVAPVYLTRDDPVREVVVPRRPSRCRYDQCRGRLG
jgi:putative restriction endonuclease